MTHEFQRVWEELIVIYLFLGGLGGASLTLASIAVYSKRILPLIAPWTSVTLGSAAEEESGSDRPNRVFTLTMSLSGVVFLAVGSLMLLLDLLQPEAMFYLLGNPGSWIFWGTIFIVVTLICGALYGWAQAAPSFDWLSQRVKARWLARTVRWLAGAGHGLQRYERVNGLMAGWFGFATAFYTGFLVTMAPAIPFWHTPALPLLFLVSAFSTAAAYALIVLAIIRRYQKGLESRIEGFDVGLILFEILLLLAYFNFAGMGSTAAKASLGFLLGDVGFWLGVLGVGLLLPLGLEFFSLLRHGRSPKLNTALSLAAGMFVLVGGYLLRHYVLAAGVFEFPW